MVFIFIAVRYSLHLHFEQYLRNMFHFSKCMFGFKHKCLKALLSLWAYL